MIKNHPFTSGSISRGIGRIFSHTGVYIYIYTHRYDATIHLNRPSTTHTTLEDGGCCGEFGSDDAFARKDAPHLPHGEREQRVAGGKRENVCGKARGGRNEREVRGKGECGLRGPHGVVKSIRPGLEPPFAGATYGSAARTASTGLWRRTSRRCREMAEGLGGLRIKYHPRYVPFENATSFSSVCVFFFASFAHLFFGSLSPVRLSLALVSSSRESARVIFVIFPFSNSTSTHRCVRIQRLEFLQNRIEFPEVHRCNEKTENCPERILKFVNNTAPRHIYSGIAIVNVEIEYALNYA